MTQTIIHDAMQYISQNQTAKVIIALVIITLVSYLAFVDGEYIGRFLYVALH